MPFMNNQFQLVFPDGWKETTVYTFEGPHDNGVQHNLVMVIDPFVTEETDLFEYAHAQLDGPKNVLPGFEFVSEGQKSFSDGSPFFEIVYKYSPAEEIVLYQKQVYVIKKMGKDFKGIVFSATFSKKSLPTIGAEVDAIIAGFCLLPVPSSMDQR